MKRWSKICVTLAMAMVLACALATTASAEPPSTKLIVTNVDSGWENTGDILTINQSGQYTIEMDGTGDYTRDVIKVTATGDVTLNFDEVSIYVTSGRKEINIINCEGTDNLVLTGTLDAKINKEDGETRCIKVETGNLYISGTTTEINVEATATKKARGITCVHGDITITGATVSVTATSKNNLAAQGICAEDKKININGADITIAVNSTHKRTSAFNTSSEPTLTYVTAKAATASNGVYNNAITWNGTAYTYMNSGVATPVKYFKTVSYAPQPAKYQSILAETVNGTASLSAAKSELNKPVTLTVTPDAGYEVEAVSILYTSGKVVAVTDNGDGTYGYKQPGAPVTVTVTFASAVPPQWYDAAKNWAEEEAVITEDFVMDDISTRGDAVLFIWKAMGCPAATIENPFTDLTGEEAYYTAALWAYEAGITTGTEDGTTFSGDWTCTRSQIVTLLWRNAGMSDAEMDNAFTDVTEGNWDYEAILWAVETAVAEGKEGQFLGLEDCTQMEIVDFLFSQVTA